MKICFKCQHRFVSDTWVCPHCGSSPDEKFGFPCFAPDFSSDSGFKDTHFNELNELEASNFWFVARNKLIIWALKKYFPNMENFLEIGCGTGFVLSGISGAAVDANLYGSEISCEGLIHAAKRIRGVQLFQMDARSIPYENEFDVIGAFDVLEHIEEDTIVLSQMYQAIKPGGGVLISVPQHQFLWSETDVNACHVRRYSANELKEKICVAGFHSVKMTSFVSLLLPFMIFSRLKQRRVRGVYDPLAELKIGRALNFIFEKIMALEKFAIQSGISFPFGGSLLVIARKA